MASSPEDQINKLQEAEGQVDAAVAGVDKLSDIMSRQTTGVEEATDADLEELLRQDSEGSLSDSTPKPKNIEKILPATILSSLASAFLNDTDSMADTEAAAAPAAISREPPAVPPVHADEVSVGMTGIPTGAEETPETTMESAAGASPVLVAGEEESKEDEDLEDGTAASKVPPRMGSDTEVPSGAAEAVGDEDLEEDGEAAVGVTPTKGEAGMARFDTPKPPMGEIRLYHIILNYLNGVKNMSNNITTMAYKMPSREIKEVDIELRDGTINVPDYTSYSSVGMGVPLPEPGAAAKEEHGAAGLYEDDDAKAGVV